jgi:4-amino-4-deoxy-L-arabinose transferase-like glycosyltransferase
MNTLKHSKAIILYLLGFFAANLAFLVHFPQVHSDEAWLAGLSRAFLESGSVSATEPFFNLYPRNPHAIKTLFHLAQSALFRILGYNLFSARLLSLVCAIAVLWQVYRLTERFADRRTAFFAMAALSLDIQFIAAAHTARQEIVILAGMTLALGRVLEGKWLKSAIITGLAIGIHPNAFLIAAMCGAVLLGTGNFNGLLKYTLVTAAFAASFIWQSLAMDASFFAHYAAYGGGLGVSDGLWDKLLILPEYFANLFNRVGGTYWLPDIRPQLAVLLPAGIIAGFMKRKSSLSLSTLGILAGLVIMGRYNQLYIVFLFPLAYISIACLLKARKTAVLTVCVLLFTGFQLFIQIPKNYKQYDGYITEIAKTVPAGAKSLANLNAGFYFDNTALLDYRNLTYLRDNELSFADYVRDNNIEYIILTSELELIYSRRPALNAVYGNPRYYPEMTEFIKSGCELLNEFRDDIYGMRIIGYQGDVEGIVRVYRVKS